MVMGAERDDGERVRMENWWAFRPLPRTADTLVRGVAASDVGNEGVGKAGADRSVRGTEASIIDAFIEAKLKSKDLVMAREAEARTLIRRLTFDLHGLPPAPEDVEAFVRDAKVDPRAYEKLVDRLLASPRYGERWARHWLDVAHYGETHGYDKDKPRPDAWPYRDYVIRAFNSDKPYARFVEEQIAGDALYPGTVDGITALGFIAAGPWDLIGHMEVPETKLDGKIARHLDRDDMVQNAIGTFCSLTVGCAQCHNHKFDPITQADYYSLQAVFAAVDRTAVPFYPDDATMARFQALNSEKQRIVKSIAAMEGPLKEKAGGAYAALTRRIEGAAEKSTNPNARPDFGYHSAISKNQDAVKWVQVDLGKSVDVERIVVKPCYDAFNQIGAGFGFPVRFKIEVSDDADFKKGVTLVWKRHDETFMNDFRNPGLAPVVINTGKTDNVRGRYVRMTAVKLAPRMNDFIFALAELQVFSDKEGANLAQGCAVAAADAIEAPPRWRKTNLTDGIAPEARTVEEKSKLMAEREALLLAAADPETRAKMGQTKRQLQRVESELGKLPAPMKVYAGAVHTGTGSFKGTGAEGGKPRVIQVLKRGDIKQPAEEVGPGGVAAMNKVLGLSFAVKGDGEAARRAALARWVTDRNNALTWRSIVNRVWQHHFGRGLVDTPNDFGRMGAEPTHPELVDWLAVTFRDELRGSVKSLHRMIVMSAAYRQSSGVRASPAAEAAQRLDASNTLLWRQNRRKLDAESVHDAILSVSGKLNLAMGGPSFQDFVIEKADHSPHYEYQLHDPNDPKSWRRSIYRFIVRSQQQPFMTVMDCADPSMRVDKRNESVSPLQALAMMNNGLTVAMARHFAARVEAEAAGRRGEQVRRAFLLALGREPSAEEEETLVGYAQKEGLPNACRLILNLNEFAFVD